MFRKAHDRKSHLILNLHSWVDFLKPKYCFFENVRGFLRYNLHARQADKHNVKGGIHTGGLKFLVHALLSMGYVAITLPHCCLIPRVQLTRASRPGTRCGSAYSRRVTTAPRRTECDSS